MTNVPPGLAGAVIALADQLEVLCRTRPVLRQHTRNPQAAARVAHEIAQQADYVAHLAGMVRQTVRLEGGDR